MRKILISLTGLTLLCICSFLVQANLLRRVSINEIAWGGTRANPFDEWIELKNNTDQEISLQGWKLISESGKINIALSGSIPLEGFYLLERTDDATVSDIPCDQTYTGTLLNSGDTLKLIGPEGSVEDTANQQGGAWPAGCGSPKYISMERVNPLREDIPSNWIDNNCKLICGVDTEGNPINGTPASENSITLQMESNQ